MSLVLVSYVLPQIWAKRIMMKSGGYDYKSGSGFWCFLLVLISSIAADDVISPAGRCPAMPGRRLVSCRSYGFLMKRLKKIRGSVPLASRF